MASVNTVVAPQLITNLAEAPNLFDFSLAWCQATIGSVEDIKTRFADTAVRDSMRADLPVLERALGKIGDWVLLRGVDPDIAKFDETPLSAVAAALGIDDLLDAFCEINLTDELRTKWFFRLGDLGMNEDHLAAHREIANDPFSIPGISDGGAHTKYSTSGHYPTRYLMSYVREHGWHTLEEAHWRLSALPAFAAGFLDRGTLVEGAPADIVVYDFDGLDISEIETVHDYPGNEWRIVDHPKGYHYILCNGEITMNGGVQTNVPSGRLLRNGRAVAAS
jgi:N-acyl-D-amino-acid deacylase